MNNKAIKTMENFKEELGDNLEMNIHGFKIHGVNRMCREERNKAHKLYYQRRRELRELLLKDFVNKIKNTEKIDKGLNFFRVKGRELSFRLIDNEIKDLEICDIRIDREKKINLLKREIKEMKKVINETFYPFPKHEDVDNMGGELMELCKTITDNLK